MLRITENVTITMVQLAYIYINKSLSFRHDGYFNIVSTVSILVQDMTTTVSFQKSSIFSSKHLSVMK